MVLCFYGSHQNRLVFLPKLIKDRTSVPYSAYAGSIGLDILFPEPQVLILRLPQHTPLLVHLFLLIEAVFTRPTIHKQQETANDRQDLEKIVFGEILMGMVLVELNNN